MLEIKNYKVGFLKTNCYLVKDVNRNCGLIVDPGEKSNDLEKDMENLDINYILLTHGHFDHILKAQKYKNITGAKIVIGEMESEFLNDDEINLSKTFYKKGLDRFNADIYVKDEDIIDFGDYKIKVMHLPGHTVGSVCYFIDDFMFSGDVLFKNGFGRTDLPTGNSDQLKGSVSKIFLLNKNFVVYPGHGESTTIFNEKNSMIGK